MDIKEKANEYRTKNGDSSLTTKELLWFVISRFDELEEKSNKISRRVTACETVHKMILWFVPLCVAAASVVTAILLKGT